MVRKIAYVSILLSVMIMGLIGCGNPQTSKENETGEIETIYSEVLGNYQKAKQLIYGAMLETGEEIEDENGRQYVLVTDSDYTDVKSVQRVLESAFSKAYIESNLEWVLYGENAYYKEINGQLCVAMADAVGESLTENILLVAEQTEDKLILEVKGDLCSYEVSLIYENDQWLIEQIREL